MKKILCVTVLLISCSGQLVLFAQTANSTKPKLMVELPYREIPDYPDVYSAQNVAARLIDGLGFRYYWATEGLRQEDLEYKPSEEARTTDQTLDHILGLTSVLLNAVKNQPNVRPSPEVEYTFDQKRRQTLENIKDASDLLRNSSTDLGEYSMVFQNPKGSTEYPFWNLLNGPIADAIWHVGQVVSFRRGSGNPFNSNVSVLRGKIRE